MDRIHSRGRQAPFELFRVKLPQVLTCETDQGDVAGVGDDLQPNLLGAGLVCSGTGCRLHGILQPALEELGDRLPRSTHQGALLAACTAWWSFWADIQACAAVRALRSPSGIRMLSGNRSCANSYAATWTGMRTVRRRRVGGSTGISRPSSRKPSRCKTIASRAIARASSTVPPSVTTPGSAGTCTE